MTRKEAQGVLQKMKLRYISHDIDDSDETRAIDVAIEALKQPEVAITPKEFKEQMAHIAETDDKEARHYGMDCCMVELLNQFGYEEGTKIFENTKKWYA